MTNVPVDLTSAISCWALPHRGNGGSVSPPLVNPMLNVRHSVTNANLEDFQAPAMQQILASISQFYL